MGKISDALERYAADHSERVEPSSEELLLGKTVGDDVHEKSVFPEAALDRLPVISKPNSPDAERFKVLRSRILFPVNGNRPKLIMVTSAFPGEGKTFVAANLAASIALGINEHVLAVDCDFRRPGLHHVLGCWNREGLHEHLTGKKELHELLLKTRVNKLTLLSAGTPPSNPSELLSSSTMSYFLEGVRNRYDDRYVIIDSAPVHISADGVVLAKCCDGIILVVKAFNGNRQIIESTVHNIGREKVIGVVFNGYDGNDKQYEAYLKSRPQ